MIENTDQFFIKRNNLYFSTVIRKDDLSQDAMNKLKSLVEYDPKKGQLRRSGSDKDDDTWIRSIDKNKYIDINRVHYSAKRIAYLCMTGEWPSNKIVFKNENPLDLRWENFFHFSDIGCRVNQEHLKYSLDYNEITGSLRWKNGVHGTTRGKVGKITNSRGGKQYLLIGYDGRHFIAAHLIWVMVYGRLPIGNITYLDKNTLNNSLSNLAEVGNSVIGGASKLPKNNTSGFKGVSFDTDKNKYNAYIKVNKKRKHLGFYENAVSAAKAYDQAAIKAWGDMAMTNEKLGLF